MTIIIRKIKLPDLVSKITEKMVTVAARLRSLRTDDPLKGHPRPIKQKLEL